MSESDAKKDKVPRSVTRLNKEIEDCIDSINTNIWPHVRALAALTGYSINPVAHNIKLDAENPAPMLKAFDMVVGLKEALNQTDIALNNLGHDLNPEFYIMLEEAKKEPDPNI
ncbi:hypothetical protein LCGC14_3091710 [marine sediment metagenome]|uniref:Uncharacterized protein n=1 Tax=marine sediment metagenome TaxID=412755 RepID=A0A0F8WAS2_9ZZZZ